jgi:hypothetical protein
MEVDALEERIAKATPDRAIQEALYDHLADAKKQTDLFAQHGEGKTFGVRSTSKTSFENLVKKAKAKVIATLTAERDARKGRAA